VASFDRDRDGKVTLAEFESYCLRINHVCWRAERIRAEVGSLAAWQASQRLYAAPNHLVCSLNHVCWRAERITFIHFVDNTKSLGVHQSRRETITKATDTRGAGGERGSGARAVRGGCQSRSRGICSAANLAC
jgi:hypothetical protein